MLSNDQDWEPPSEADMKLIAARRERSDQISKLMSGYLLKGYKMLGSLCDKCDTILLQDRQGNNHCVACSELDSDTDKDNPAINESAAISMARELEMASAAGSVAPSITQIVSGASSSAQTLEDYGSGTQPCASAPLPTTIEQDKEKSKGKLSSDGGVANLSITSIDVQSFAGNLSNSIQRGQQNSSSSLPSTVLRPESATGAGGDSGVFSMSVDRKPRLSGAEITSSSDSNSNSTHVSRLCDKISWASKELENTPSLEYSIQLCQLIRVASEAIVALRNARL